jgi:hypothetical protein
VADLLAQLGGVPPEWVLLDPPPGTAREEDVLALDDHEDRLCELIDGTLVEKTVGLKGVTLVWFIYPKMRTIQVYTSPRKKTILRNGALLTGGEVLPGFAVAVYDLFDRLNPPDGP